MTVESDARPHEMGRRLSAALAGADGIVQGLWMTTSRGAVTFWILTGPIDTVMQQSLYERSTILYDDFPEAVFDVHVLNPDWFEGGDALSALPPAAQPIALSAA